MALKLTVFFNQFSQGWTETYYSQSPVDPATYLGGISPAQMSKLVAYRHPSVSLVALRASTIGVARQSSTTIYSGGQSLMGQSAGYGPGNDTADVSTTDAFCDLFDNSYHRRPLYVRGLNDLDIQRTPTGVSQPSPNLIKALGAHVAALTYMGWCIQVENRPPAGTLIWSTVGILTAVGESTSFSTPFPVPGIVAGQTQLVFQGIPRNDIPGFPRIATVTNYTVAGGTTGITIAYRLRCNGGLVYVPPKMKFTLVSNAYFPITGWYFMKFGERKTGRPIGQSRGRSRPAVRAQ